MKTFQFKLPSFILRLAITSKSKLNETNKTKINGWIVLHENFVVRVSSYGLRTVSYWLQMRDSGAKTLLTCHDLVSEFNSTPVNQRQVRHSCWMPFSIIHFYEKPVN